MSKTKSSDSINSFFDGYINDINVSTNVHVLIKQYEKAIASQHEKEVKADYDTINTTPILKMPSPMEKQASDLYTKKIFVKFQEELVETMAHTSSFQSRKCSYASVTLSLEIMDKSCQKWVVLHNHALGLPCDYQESSTACCDILCREAIKYVEGAESMALYNVAMEALCEATKKVAAAKQNGPSVIQSNLANISDQEVGNKAKTSDQEVSINENELGQLQSCSVNQDQKIQELNAELENTSRICEAYRAKPLGALNIMEEQKLKISVKVQNVRLS